MRTWEQNKISINQLWPQCQWTEEERRLWTEDLSGLDQDVLYDAMRNVKRSHDTLYPQLKWMLSAYRELSALRRNALRPAKAQEQKLDLHVDDEEDRLLAKDFVAVIEASAPAEYLNVETMVLDKLPRMHAATAGRLLGYARERLLGEKSLFGRVDDSGDVTPFRYGAIK